MMKIPTPLDKIDSFADESDVIVLGYGIAGACAALEARRADGDVLVVERTSGAGGAVGRAARNRADRGGG